MNKGKLIAYGEGDVISLTKLKKDLGEDYKEAIEKEYFIPYDNSDEEKFIFTEKGKKFAWGKE